MAYSSASDVAILCSNLISGSLNFSQSTNPTLAAVNNWLSSGCGRIETAIKSAGYSTPVSQSSAPAVYDSLRDLNSFYAAGMAEMVRTNARIGPRERTRGQLFMEWFEDGIKRLVSSDLGRAGLSTSGTGKLFAGGISQSDKETQESDTDRVRPRFQRDMMDYPGLLTTSDVATSGSLGR